MRRLGTMLRRAFAARARWLCAATVVCGAIVHVTAIGNPFVYDDFRTVVDNPTLQPHPNLRAVVLHDSMRPLASLSFAMDRALWGPGPFGFHVTSLLLHLLNIALVFAVARRAALDAMSSTTDRPDRSLATAVVTSALFAVHPALTQAVGYISARADLLCAAASLTTILLFRHAITSGRARWYVAMLGGWMLAIAAKELAVVLPLVLLGYDLLLSAAHPGLRGRIWRFHVPVLAATTAVAALRVFVLWQLEHALRPALHWSHLLVEADAVRRYVSLLCLASPQLVYHAVPAMSGLADPRALFALVWLLALALLTWRAGVRDRLAALGVAWFLVMLLPPAVLVLLNVGEPMAEHRVYLPSIGAFLAVGGGIGAWWARLGPPRRVSRTVLTASVALLLVVLGERTIARYQVWSNPVWLWTEAANHASGLAWPHQMLGEALERGGRCDAAVAAYRAAIAAQPAEPQPYLRAGMCLTTLGRLADAAATFEQARQVAPRSSRPLLGLGTVALLEGRTADAQQFFERAIALEPQNMELRASIAQAARILPGQPAGQTGADRTTHGDAPDVTAGPERRPAPSTPAAGQFDR